MVVREEWQRYTARNSKSSPSLISIERGSGYFEDIFTITDNHDDKASGVMDEDRGENRVDDIEERSEGTGLFKDVEVAVGVSEADVEGQAEGVGLEMTRGNRDDVWMREINGDSFKVCNTCSELLSEEN